MSAKPNVLLLGGTTEASALARLLAERSFATILSYAGRTRQPRTQPVPTRVGGFGGVEGLIAYLRQERITHLIDATHPFAATMSMHAVRAAQRTGVPLAALSRPAWTAQAGDRWPRVPDLAGAVTALAGTPRRVMLALGRMHVDAFAAQPQHRYLLRFVDAPEHAPALPHHDLVMDRGPFTVEGDTDLLRAHGIDLIVCKNAGGDGASAKLTAARALHIPVLMIDRPPVPSRREFHDPQAVLDWIAHDASCGSERGV